MNSTTQNATTATSDATNAVNPTILRSIRIVRNEAGYGFTLSRYIIFYEENVASAQAEKSNDAETDDQKSSKLNSSKKLANNKSGSNLLQRTYHSSIREAPSSKEILVNNATDNKNDSTSNELPKRKYDFKLKQNEIVFVKHVRVGSAAYLAGLREGDRLISINNISLSDKTYSDIILIIENSGNTLDLKVTTSSSASIEPALGSDASAKKKSKSLSSDIAPLNESNTNDKNDNANTFNVAGKLFDSSSTTTAMSSNSQVKNENKSSTLTNTSKTTTASDNNNNNDINKILQYGGAGENLKPRNSNLGFSSLGMSALFYSFLKNNNSNQKTTSPPSSATIVDPKKLNEVTQFKNRPPLIETPSLDNRLLNDDDNNKMLNKSNMNTRASPLTQQKLRNLQEAIVKQYPKEQLTSLGVVIPNVASFDLGFTSSEEINKQPNDQNAFSPSSASSPFKSIERSENPQESSVLLTDAQKQSSPSGHSKLEDQNNKISEWFHSLNRKNSYNEKQQQQQQSNKNNFKDSSTSKAPTRYLRGEQDNFLGAKNNNNNNEQIPSGQSTPISILSTTSLVDSTSSTLSRNALLTSPTNSESTIFNEDDAMQNDSMLPNSSNYGLTATNQKTPLEFSRYIKCVHKALHENDNNTKRGYFSANELDSDRHNQNQYDFLQPDEIDYLKNESASSSVLTNQDITGQSVKPTRIVENRRQVFEKSQSMNSSLKQIDNKNVMHQMQQQQQQQQQQQPKNAGLTQTKSASPVKAIRPNFTTSNEQRPKPPSDGPSSHRSSVGEASDSSKTTPNSQGGSQNQIEALSKSNQSAKKRTGDECRQIMSRANIETVAERAAHFEDVDFEKFNRLKSKLEEYDWYQDQEQPTNQIPVRDPIDKQKLRMLLYGYKDQNNNKSMSNEGFYNYEKYINSLNQKQDSSYDNKNLFMKDYQTRDENGALVYSKIRDNEIPKESTLRYDQKNLNKFRSVSQSDQSIWNDYDDKWALNKHLAGGSTNEFNRHEKNYASHFQDDQKRNMLITQNASPNAQVKREKNYFFHDPSPIARSANVHQRNKGDSDMISTDSDIGTSPSGTTFASQPSSPQQINPSTDNSPNYPESYNLYNFFADYANKRILAGATPKSTIHSDLSSVIESDMIKKQSPEYFNPNLGLRQGYLEIVDHLQGLSIASKKQIDEILNENEFILNQKFFGNANDPYYFSPSSTLMRQQKLLQLKQSLQKQQKIEKNVDNTLKKDNSLRSKSSPRGVNLLDQAQGYNKLHDSTQYSYDERKIMPLSKDDADRLRKTATESVLTSNNSILPENIDKAHKKDANADFPSNFGHEHHDNHHKHFKKLFASSFQPTKNSSIRKLKYFFGEKFHPVILQAVENKNIIASDEYLSRIFETIREGVLNCKILIKEGKRSNDRSWRPAWAVLKSNGALFLCKEKKDNIMIPSVDSYPIDLKNCEICIAYDYNKRKNVFKLNTINNYEYLFQAVDYKSMSEWIKALQVYSRAQEASGGGSSSLVSTDSSASSSMRRLESSVSPLNKFISHPQTIITSDLISTPEELFYPNYEHQQPQAIVNSTLKKPNLVVGLNVPRNEEIVPRRDPNNKKWVRQMTKRLKGFVTSSSFVDFEHASSHNELMSLDNGSSYERRNFGLPLEKCESSSFSHFVPVVVEICTRLIELHINDEGLYRKVGQKQVVYFLRNQLDNGVAHIDVNDPNWNNPHVVVSLLKCFLNELPDSLATSSNTLYFHLSYLISDLYGEFINACQLENHQMRLFSIKQLLNRLPQHNYETIKYLSAHLRRVAAAFYYNKMTIKNISISFSQSIVRHNLANCEQIRCDHMFQCLIVELCLVYYEWLFDLSISKNVPIEVKEPIEEHLFQTIYNNQERINYSDLLINIIEIIGSSRLSNESHEPNYNSKKTLNINVKSLVRD